MDPVNYSASDKEWQTDATSPVWIIVLNLFAERFVMCTQTDFVANWDDEVLQHFMNNSIAIYFPNFQSHFPLLALCRWTRRDYLLFIQLIRVAMSHPLRTVSEESRGILETIKRGMSSSWTPSIIVSLFPCNLLLSNRQCKFQRRPDELSNNF